MDEIRKSEIEVKEHPHFRTINVNGVFGGVRGAYLEVVIFSDEVKLINALSTFNISAEKATLSRTIEARLIMDPLQAKTIAQWLTSHVNEYEKQFGRIPSPEELHGKAVSQESVKDKNNKAVYQ